MVTALVLPRTSVKLSSIVCVFCNHGQLCKHYFLCGLLVMQVVDNNVVLCAALVLEQYVDIQMESYYAVEISSLPLSYQAVIYLTDASSI